MKNDENKGIGELIQELIDFGFGEIQIDVDDSLTDKREVFVRVSSPHLDGDACFEAFGTCVVEPLRELVDDVRKFRGHPSLAEELAKMLEADAATDSLPLTFGNPIARCVKCGRSWNFKIERKGICSIDPHSGHVAPACTPDRLAFGEIFTCTNCGQHYTVSR